MILEMLTFLNFIIFLCLIKRFKTYFKTRSLKSLFFTTFVVKNWTLICKISTTKFAAWCFLFHPWGLKGMYWGTVLISGVLFWWFFCMQCWHYLDSLRSVLKSHDGVCSLFNPLVNYDIWNRKIKFIWSSHESTPLSLRVISIFFSNSITLELNIKVRRIKEMITNWRSSWLLHKFSLLAH